MKFGVMLPYIQIYEPERKIMCPSKAGMCTPICDFKNKIYNHMERRILKYINSKQPKTPYQTGQKGGNNLNLYLETQGFWLEICQITSCTT
jgi:hypothetical protein